MRGARRVAMLCAMGNQRACAIVLVALLLASASVEAAPPEPASDLAELEEQARIACHLPPAADTAQYPWYFHYQLSLLLMERDDWARSVESLQAALDRRPDPSEHGRTYGMWLIAYRPYFQLGRAHLELGNYACARDALERSRSTGEIADSDPQAAERDALLKEIQRQLD